MNAEQVNVLTILTAIERMTADVAGLKEKGTPFNHSIERIGIQAKTIDRAVERMKGERREPVERIIDHSRFVEDDDGMLWAK